MRECGSELGTGSESGRERAETKARSESGERNAGSEERKADRSQMSLSSRRGRTERRSFERSLYRFEGLKARSGPGYARVYQAISNGGLAQLGERVLCKHEVIGSSPIFSTVRADSSAG